MTTIPGVHAVAVFAEPHGVPAALGVAAEHGDVNIHVELAGHAFCTFVLTQQDALDLNLKIASCVLDAQRGEGAGR
jgi:hypothetical protein